MRRRPWSTAGSTRCSRSCSAPPTKWLSGCSARAKTRLTARRKPAPGRAPTGPSSHAPGARCRGSSAVSGNLAIDRWRRSRRARAHEAAFVAATLDPGPDRVDLYRALDALPRRQREVVVLRYLADLPEAEVAEVIGCSLGTVKSNAVSGTRRVARRADDRGGPDVRPTDLDDVTPVEPDDEMLARVHGAERVVPSSPRIPALSGRGERRARARQLRSVSR